MRLLLKVTRCNNFFSKVLFAVLIRIKAVLITLSVVAGIPRRPIKRPQAVLLIRSQAECVNAI